MIVRFLLIYDVLGFQNEKKKENDLIMTNGHGIFISRLSADFIFNVTSQKSF